MAKSSCQSVNQKMILKVLVVALNIGFAFSQGDSSAGNYLPLESEGTCGKAVNVGQPLFGDFPYLGAVGYSIGGQVSYESDAILINRRYVLTHAAFHNLQHPVEEVILGQTSFESGSCAQCKPVQKFKINPTDVSVHEGFNVGEMLKEGNELLLIRLPEPVVTNLEDKQAPVLPICVPWNAPAQPGELLVAAWERKDNDTSSFGAIKSSVAQFLNGDQCKKIPAYTLLNTDKHLCAGEADGSDVCIGRNGAPLIDRVAGVSYLRGMASFGPVPCHTELTKGIPGVYANINYYIPWLKAHLLP